MLRNAALNYTNSRDLSIFDEKGYILLGGGN